MLRTKQKLDAQGIHIPLPFVEQYGLSPGTEVIVEFGPDGIFLSPAVVDAEKIETQALRLLFRKLGDAIKVRVQQDKEIAGLHNPWRVDVYGSDANHEDCDATITCHCLCSCGGFTAWGWWIPCGSHC